MLEELVTTCLISTSMGSNTLLQVRSKTQQSSKGVLKNNTPNKAKKK